MTAATTSGQSPSRAALTMLRQRRIGALVGAMRSYLNAKWTLRHAQVRGSGRLFGKALIKNDGAMSFGDRVRLDGTAVRLEFVCWEGATLSVGDGTYFNYGTNVSAMDRVQIGSNCAIGQYCIIMDSDYHSTEDHRVLGPARPIVIEDDVWLGARVIVLRGAHIGRGAVIGANSVVRGDIPPYTLAAGSPARVIRQLREAPHAPPD